MNDRGTGDRDASAFAGRYASPEPITHADGAYIVDRDGSRHVDFVLGNLTQILGHGRLDCRAIVNDVISKHWNVGDWPNEYAYNLGQLLLEVSGQARLRLTNSGSEAVHLAIRLARAATGRTKIVKFAGHYHGWFSEEIVSFLPAEISVGLPPGAGDHLIVLPWNNRADVQQAFDRYGDDIAAVICEPVLAHAGTVPPFDDFLSFLRQLSRNNGSLLIFDECITGFRLAVGGAQQFYGVKSDLVTYSKALTNGLPLGVVAGSEFAFAPATAGDVFHASTYDGNPLCAAVATHLIRELLASGAIDLARTNAARLANGLREVFSLTKRPVVVQECGSFFQVFFTEASRVRDYHEAMATDWKTFRAFARGMADRGVRISEGDLGSDVTGRRWLGSWFVSAAHGESVSSHVLDSALAVARAL